jgi:cytochrome c-type biogenesis protein CcmH
MSRVAAIAAVALLLGMLLWHGLASTGYAQSADDVARELMCQCGCGYTLDACGKAMNCDVSEQMYTAIEEALARGETKSEIIDAFVAQYGETVLAAPTKGGFNLSAWLVPFLAVGVGGAFASWLVRNGVRRGAAQPEGAAGESPEQLRSYEKRVEDDLRRRMG